MIRRSAGFTLVEIAIALAVLALAMLGFLSLMSLNVTQDLMTRQKITAMNAAREQIELMISDPFAEIFARYNEPDGDDPDGAGTAPGPHFAVPGLTPLPADADGRVGRVLFPLVDGLLREDCEDERLEMPRDLNGDGVVDAANRSMDYRMLPVTVRLEFVGATGPTVVEFRTRLFPR